MIDYRLKKALGRKKLLLNVIDLVYDIELLSTFARKIFKFLTNGDLK